jgi:hypothetical protein
MPKDGRVRPKHVVEEYTGVSKSSQTVIVVIASVKGDEKGGQGHCSASLFHQSAT